ncbi:hypothetical protein JCM31826_14730 [Thermaurantimonas aggregans]|uniref:Nucleotidyltransferase n=1 Tax=Thermaurantimonas aggregans TaxID=2173829 RepID=A0A401XLV7_9FLAO|nr:DUF294 nucleotidyltransferase-like domain-containing protein [Thermaurantimonas aggregans]MCX8149533.1 DUF294 nucleotidyltransferase-like domain-containing protein [Thermaurantimonas aggregans]GCD77991.1 hypothetical protein JCM31826_14730 [Thermaurantimonas aggregans]
MSTNPIAERIFQFLKKHPPYDKLTEEDLEKLCKSSSLIHYSDGDVIFKAGDPIQPHVFVVFKGLVHLKWPNSQEVFDSAEPGDTFGIRAAFSGNPYVLTAETAKESLVLTLDLIFFRHLLNSNARFSSFFASGLASGTIPQNHHWDNLHKGNTDAADEGSTLDEILKNHRTPVVSRSDDLLPSIAQLMIDNNVGSVVIIDENQRPKGIVTDKDIRRIVAKKFDPTALKASDVMSSPVITISNKLLWSDAYIKMAEHGIRHLVLTADGTDQTSVMAVLSEHDLLRRNSAQMLSVLKKLKTAQEIAALAATRQEAEKRISNLLNNDLPIEKITILANRVNDLTVQRAISLAINDLREDLEYPLSDNWCWLALGSYGRQEQIIRTDQDNALIFTGSDHFRKLFLKLANQVNTYLAECGYEKCPAEVMASNPKWCLTVEEWKKTFSHWIHEPDPKAVMHTTIFFDFRPVFGNDTLASDLARYISSEIDTNKKFLTYLAANALASPPAFNFFKSLAVEDSGEHKGMFDLKAKALAPYADCARLFAIYHKIWGVTDTVSRYQSVATLEPHYTDLLRDAAKAYQWLTKIRVKNALANGRGGRWLPKDFLSPLERQILKKALMPLQELKSIAETRFQTHFVQ